MLTGNDLVTTINMTKNRLNCLVFVLGWLSPSPGDSGGDSTFINASSLPLKNKTSSSGLLCPVTRWFKLILSHLGQEEFSSPSSQGTADSLKVHGKKILYNSWRVPRWEVSMICGWMAPKSSLTTLLSRLRAAEVMSSRFGSSSIISAYFYSLCSCSNSTPNSFITNGRGSAGRHGQCRIVSWQ